MLPGSFAMWMPDTSVSKVGEARGRRYRASPRRRRARSCHVGTPPVRENAKGSRRGRLAPLLKVDRLAWRELGQEHPTTRGLTQDEESRRDYFILGYRWDF